MVYNVLGSSLHSPHYNKRKIIGKILPICSPSSQSLFPSGISPYAVSSHSSGPTLPSSAIGLLLHPSLTATEKTTVFPVWALTNLGHIPPLVRSFAPYSQFLFRRVSLSISCWPMQPSAVGIGRNTSKAISVRCCFPQSTTLHFFHAGLGKFPLRGLCPFPGVYSYYLQFGVFPLYLELQHLLTSMFSLCHASSPVLKGLCLISLASR